MNIETQLKEAEGRIVDLKAQIETKQRQLAAAEKLADTLRAALKKEGK